MAHDHIAEDIRLCLAQSIVIVDRHRLAIAARLQECLAAMDTADDAFGQGEVTAMMLTDLLFEEARQLATSGRLGRLSAVAREHRRLDIGGVHHSRFGSILGSVLREVLGPRLPPRIASAWVDAYWFVIRQLTSLDPALAQRGSGDGERYDCRAGRPVAVVHPPSRR